ncbi:ankyrin repeat domain-containing protein [Wolbachia endosymbiont (group B) of Aporia crataegi]|uniref:ankyrin repeat domain-containing protein n=1 Tax=Wolbachia endosymbiont (group B) of Aporia crataegi TaxID=2953981 RepID=UPI0029D41C06|nr:ankyrin repeat domain-containing protein [Wolbachia endosymbiont (group B) of Aporia crataegi]
MNAKDNYGYTPLHVASFKDHLNVVEKLLDRGTDINAKDNDGLTPLELANNEGRSEIVVFLISYKNEYGYTLLHYAAKNNNSDLVDLLLTKGADINAKDNSGNTPLHLATLNGKLQVVKKLLEKGADINAKDNSGNTPLHLATFMATLNGELQVLEKLLDMGADINAKNNRGSTPLHIAAEHGHLEVVEKLLDERAKIYAKNNDGLTPLELANNENKSEVVNFLLGYKDKSGYMLLHYAAQDNNSGLIGFLLEKGARIDAQNNDDSTPLHLAALNGHLSAVKKLLDKGARINAKNNDDCTPLHLAASYGQLKVVKELLDRGANVDAKSNDSYTSLHFAAKFDHLNIVKYLIKEGADVNVKNSDGDTPLNIATKLNRLDIIKYFKSEGALRSRRSIESKELPKEIEDLHYYYNELVSDNSLQSNKIDYNRENNNQAASGASKPSSWINCLFSWVKSSMSGLLGSRATLSEEKLNTKSSISQPMDVDGTILLLDVLVRKVTGQKYISTVGQSIPPLEAQGYALNITEGFEKVVNQAALRSGISMHRLNIDFVEIQQEVKRKIIRGKYNEISGILNSHIEKACPGGEAGKLSPKKFDKLIAQFDEGLLNQSIEQILHNRDGRLEVDDTKQMSLEPQSYLSNASVHSHSKVSTCLSEIGVTKLGGNINR